MAWSIKINEHNKIIELTYLGLVSPKELEDAMLAAATLSKEKNTALFLADCSEMEGGHSITDLYFLISHYESLGLRGMKEALVLPSLQSPQADVEFYETACINRGFNVKIFRSVQKARAWLSK